MEKTLRNKLEGYIDTIEHAISLFEKMEEWIDTHADDEIPLRWGNPNKWPFSFFNYAWEDQDGNNEIREICDEVDLYSEFLDVFVRLHSAEEDDFERVNKESVLYGEYQETLDEIPNVLIFLEKVIFAIKDQIKRLDRIDSDISSLLVHFKNVFNLIPSAEKWVKNTDIKLHEHTLNDLFQVSYSNGLETPFPDILQGIKKILKIDSLDIIDSDLISDLIESRIDSLDIIDSDLISDLIESREMVEYYVERRFDRTRAFKRWLSDWLSFVENTIDDIIDQLEEQL